MMNTHKLVFDLVSFVLLLLSLGILNEGIILVGLGKMSWRVALLFKGIALASFGWALMGASMLRLCEVVDNHLQYIKNEREAEPPKSKILKLIIALVFLYLGATMIDESTTYRAISEMSGGAEPLLKSLLLLFGGAVLLWYSASKLCEMALSHADQKLMQEERKNDEQ